MQATIAKIGAAVLAVINALSGMGIALPAYMDAEGVNLFSAAALACAVAVKYVLDNREPVEPA